MTNEKYQLASPKEHVRDTLTDDSTFISRHKADLFQAPANRAVKSQALEVLLKENLTTREGFAHALQKSGFEVKVRNQGKDSEYLNVKAPESVKGVNLKDNVFGTEFIALPQAQKRQNLDKTFNPIERRGSALIKRKRNITTTLSVGTRCAPMNCVLCTVETVRSTSHFPLKISTSF
ncbi:relaxase [Vibrio astriarenae]|nr:relaxase [Vibrio sp. C7]